MGGKSSGTKAKPKFKSYAEARKDREKFRKKLVRAMEQSSKLLVSCSEDQLQLSWILIDWEYIASWLSTIKENDSHNHNKRDKSGGGETQKQQNTIRDAAPR